MEITYIGHACFEIKGEKTTIVIDPYDKQIGYDMPEMKADILITSHDHFDHSNIDAVSGYKLLINGPGEYEVDGTFIYGFSTFHDAKGGEERGKNTVYLIDIDGFSLVHLGDLGHELSKDTLEKISEVSVLMVPVGGIFTIDAKTATKVISSLEPGIVIPMHYQTKDLKIGETLAGVDKFLDEMGIDDAKQAKSLKLKNLKDVPEETEVVVLKPSS